MVSKSYKILTLIGRAGRLTARPPFSGQNLEPLGVAFRCLFWFVESGTLYGARILGGVGNGGRSSPHT